MPDPTDEAVKVLGKLLAEAPEQGEWEWDEHCEGVAMYVLSKIPTDVLARVVAGRPDQPTQTTPLAEGTIYRYEDNGGPVIRIAMDIVNVRRSDLVDRRVTVYATDKETPRG